MKRKLRFQVISLDKQIKEVFEREKVACYASARGEQHEDMFTLQIIRHGLEDKRRIILEHLNKPTLFQRVAKHF